MRVVVSKNPDRGGRCYKCVNGSRVFAIAGMSGELEHFDVNPGFVILQIFFYFYFFATHHNHDSGFYR